MALAIAQQLRFYTRTMPRYTLFATRASDKPLLLATGRRGCAPDGQRRVAGRRRHLVHRQEVGRGQLYLVVTEQAIQCAVFRPHLELIANFLEQKLKQTRMMHG